MKSTACQCKPPSGGSLTIECERHGIRKNAAWIELCRTRPNYFVAWEEGRGPGQTIAASAKPARGRDSTAPSDSAGTELKKLLTRFGIKPRGCWCNQRAAKMDRQGTVWCRDNVDKITGWLVEEARKRNYPLAKLSRPAIKVLVRWAIKRSERRHV